MITEDIPYREQRQNLRVIYLITKKYLPEKPKHLSSTMKAEVKFCVRLPVHDTSVNSTRHGAMNTAHGGKSRSDAQGARQCATCFKPPPCSSRAWTTKIPRHILYLSRMKLTTLRLKSRQTFHILNIFEHPSIARRADYLHQVVLLAAHPLDKDQSTCEE